ncbi:unnamed protein product [Cuscuta epithymum]|uniref:RING-type domain-containing protein n=1 Tax=Cuscuta epithymum TaxID=186058 RepID=A0AAV0CR09_9ASTE|nr:unnamed protein product [Cuscuta epithymum]
MANQIFELQIIEEIRMATMRASPLPNSSALRITRAPNLSAAAAPYFPARWRSGSSGIETTTDAQQQDTLFLDGLQLPTTFEDVPSFPAERRSELPPPQRQDPPFLDGSLIRIGPDAPHFPDAAAPCFPAGGRSGIETAFAPRDRRPQLPPPRRQRQYDLFVDGVLVSTGFVDPPSFPAAVSPSRTNREPEACRVCLDDVIPHNIESNCIVKWVRRNRCLLCRAAPIID